MGILIRLALGVVVFVVYLLTLAPSVVGGDSGELITMAYRLGVAHPPGYPLYTLLAHAFTWIPHGTIAWRVGVFSAFAMSLAVVAVAETIYRVSRNWGGALGGALLFAFSPLVWKYATQAEVFALHAALMAALFALTAGLWERRASTSRLWLALAAVSGLALAHHHTSIFYLLPVWILVLRNLGGAKFRRKLWAQIVFAFALGLSPYLYLFWAGVRAPLGSWGETGRLSGFFRHLLRTDYGTFQLIAKSPSPASEEFYLGSGLRAYFESLPGETLWIASLAAVAGFLLWRKSQEWRTWAGGVAFAWGFYLVSFHLLANLSTRDPVHREILSRFWIQAEIPLFIFIGLGLSWVRWSLPSVGLGLFLGVTAGAVQYHAQDQSGNLAVSEYAHGLLKGLPENAIYLSQGDLQTFPLLYFLECEGERPDVVLMDRQWMAYPWFRSVLSKRYPGLRLSGSVDLTLSHLIPLWTPSLPVYLGDLNEDEKKLEIWKSFRTWRVGFAHRVLPRNQVIDLDQESSAAWKVFKSVDFKMLDLYHGRAWELVAWNEFWESIHQEGHEFVGYAISHHNYAPALRQGIAFWEMIWQKLPSVQAPLLKNLGIAYSMLAEKDPSDRTRAHDQAVRAFRQFLLMVPPSDPDYPLVRRALENLNF